MTAVWPCCVAVLYSAIASVFFFVLVLTTRSPMVASNLRRCEMLNTDWNGVRYSASWQQDHVRKSPPLCLQCLIIVCSI